MSWTTIGFDTVTLGLSVLDVAHEARKLPIFHQMKASTVKGWTGQPLKYSVHWKSNGQFVKKDLASKFLSHRQDGVAIVGLKAVDAYAQHIQPDELQRPSIPVIPAPTRCVGGSRALLGSAA